MTTYFSRLIKVTVDINQFVEEIIEFFQWIKIMTKSNISRRLVI